MLFLVYGYILFNGFEAVSLQVLDIAVMGTKQRLCYIVEGRIEEVSESDHCCASWAVFLGAFSLGRE